MIDANEPPRCPHCGEKLSKWQPPPQTSWGDAIQYACFNDDCPYFLKGWNWMAEKFSVHASYRYRYDPQTGESGPLPVWSFHALKNQVVESSETD